MDKNNGKKSSFFGLGVLLGTVIGAVTALFLSPQSGKENREWVGAKIEELKKLWKEKQVEEHVVQIFGEVTDEAKAIYVKTKEQLVEKLHDVKERMERVDSVKYQSLVEQVISELKKETKFTDKVWVNLKNQLIEDWKKVTS